MHFNNKKNKNAPTATQSVRAPDSVTLVFNAVNLALASNCCGYVFGAADFKAITIRRSNITAGEYIKISTQEIG